MPSKEFAAAGVSVVSFESFPCDVSESLKRQRPTRRTGLSAARPIRPPTIGICSEAPPAARRAASCRLRCSSSTFFLRTSDPQPSSNSA
eukprot:4845057-Prymnesium_polylepis.2